jgi:hypothetical protein
VEIENDRNEFPVDETLKVPAPLFVIDTKLEPSAAPVRVRLGVDVLRIAPPPVPVDVRDSEVVPVTVAVEAEIPPGAFNATTVPLILLPILIRAEPVQPAQFSDKAAAEAIGELTIIPAPVSVNENELNVSPPLFKVS